MKNLFSMIMGVIVAVVIAFGVIILIGWKRVPDLIANELSKKLKVNVEIGSITGDLNSITVTNIEIDNPSHSVLSQAFTCERMDFHAAVSNYLDQDVVIQEIDLDGVYFDLEFDNHKGKNGNWSEIMNTVSDPSDELKNEAKGQADTKDATRTVLIRHLVLTNINTDLVYRDKGIVEHLTPIDRIELNDLSSEGGPLMSQLMKLVIGQSLKAVFEKQNIKHGLPGGHARYLLPLRRLKSACIMLTPINSSTFLNM